MFRWLHGVTFNYGWHTLPSPPPKTVDGNPPVATPNEFLAKDSYGSMKNVIRQLRELGQSISIRTRTFPLSCGAML
jgi:hypothetical protein